MGTETTKLKMYGAQSRRKVELFYECYSFPFSFHCQFLRILCSSSGQKRQNQKTETIMTLLLSCDAGGFTEPRAREAGCVSIGWHTTLWSCDAVIAKMVSPVLRQLPSNLRLYSERGETQQRICTIRDIRRELQQTGKAGVQVIRKLVKKMMRRVTDEMVGDK